jgi:hypothetical protein
MIKNTYSYGGAVRSADATEARGKITLTALALLLFLLPVTMLFFTGELRNSTARALRLCATAVIPSLFPFIVANQFFTWSGAAKTLGRPLLSVTRIVFGLGGACASAILTGLVCGYPSGAACAFGLYAMGECTSDEAERCAAIASNAGPAFVIGGIGGAMLGDVRLGAVIWCSTVAVSLLSGVILKFFASDQSAATAPMTSDSNGGRFSPAALIADSAAIMLKICAFITVFSVAADAAGAFGDILGLDGAAGALLRGIFELTSAADFAAGCLPARYAAVVIAAIVGWSGLSVHMQTASLLQKGLSLGRYYIVKLISAPASAALCALLILLTGI